MPDSTFTLAIGYWQRQRARAQELPCSWAAADAGAVRDELVQLAELGFTRVDLTLRWAEAQPGPARLNMPALNGLERALDAAHAAGLQASIDVLGGVFGGALHLPLWAVGYRMPGDLLRARRFGPAIIPAAAELPPILADDRYRHEPAGDLFGDGDLRAAAAYLIREVVGGLAAHPAAAVWQLGLGIARVRRPAAAPELQAWWQDLAALALSQGARSVSGSVDSADLRRSAGLRPEWITAAGAAVGVACTPIPFGRQGRPWATDDVRFLHALTAELLRSETGRTVPVHVTAVGIPTASETQAGWVTTEAFGKPAMVFLADAEQQAAWLETTLAALYQAGAAGVTLAAYADQPVSAWEVPPLDRSWLGRTGGIVGANGREKPAAAVVRAFAAQLRSGALPPPGAPPSLQLDPERYWRDPDSAFMRLAQEQGT